MSLAGELGRALNRSQQIETLTEFAKENLGWDSKDPVGLSVFLINKFKAMEGRIDDLEMDLDI